MASFELTAEQESAVTLCLEAARIAADQGEPGIVLGQIGYQKGDGLVLCWYGFVEHERAKKIKAILDGKGE